MDRFKGFSALFLAAILYGINDILIKVIGTQLTAYQQLAFRSAVGASIILAVILLTRPSWDTKKTVKTSLLIYALSFPASFILFTLAILNGKIVSVVFAFYAGAFLFSFLIGALFFKETITPKKMIGLLLVLSGLFCFTYPFEPQDISLGFLLGLFASSIMVLTNSLSKRLAESVHYEILSLLQMTAGVVIGSLAIVALDQTFLPKMTPPIVVTVIVSGGLLAAVIFLAAYGFKHFDLHLGTIVVSLELFFAPLLAFFVFQEQITNYQLAGGILLAAAISLSNLSFKTSASNKKLTLRK